jgi:uncharacterized membrane protein YhfC
MDVFVRFLAPFLMIALGLGVGVLAAQRLNVGWRLYGAGAITFVASQVLHIPFNLFLLSPGLQELGLDVADLSDGVALVIVAIAFGLSAGVFEEVGRYLMMRIWRKDVRSWDSAVMLGAGHGGIEAVLLGLLGLLTVIQLVGLQNPNVFAQVPAEDQVLVQAQLIEFWSLPWYAILLAPIERVSAICLHLTASVLVLQVFRRNNLLWLGAAIGLHTLFNAVALIAVQHLGVYTTEGLLLVLALLSLWAFFRLREPAVESPPNDPPDPPARFEPQPLELSDEKLGDSRYV